MKAECVNKFLFVPHAQVPLTTYTQHKHVGVRIMEISHTNSRYVKVFRYPSWFRSIKELTLKTNTMNISSTVKPLGDAVMFKYLGELTVEKNSMDESNV